MSLPEPLPNNRRGEWCGVSWVDDAANLHLCCYPKEHGHYGHCYRAIEHKPCNHTKCKTVRGGWFDLSLRAENPEQAERNLATLMFLSDHNRPRQMVTLQFCGWELVLLEDGTYYANDTSGG